jgi:glycerate dehydrogenase
VSVHCPLTDGTRGMIDKDAIALMKTTARLINTARGAVVNENDLIVALQEKRIAGAMLDVQEHEPPADDSPLYTLENVYLTPHIGWKRLETRQRLVDTVAANVEAFLKGDPINVIKL